MNEVRSFITAVNEQTLRVTVITPNGTCSKTCSTAAEAQGFIAHVKAAKSWVASRRQQLAGA